MPERQNAKCETDSVNSTDNPTSSSAEPKLSHDHWYAFHRSLWRILVQRCGRHGIDRADMLEAAEEYDIDAAWTKRVLDYWLDHGYVQTPESPNRLVPQQQE